MTTRKTSTSKSRTTSAKNSTGKKVTRSSGKSKVITQSALEKNVASLNTKSGSSKTTSNVKSSRTTKQTQTKHTTKKNRGVKHTRSSKIELFPVNCMPWRLEPRTNKFNLSWYMCFDHAVDQIERSNLQPRDYKLMCYTSVPLTDPLTGGVRIQRYVRS